MTIKVHLSQIVFVLQVVLVCLKLFGIISIPWLAVFVPVFLYGGAIILGLAFLLGVALFTKQKIQDIAEAMVDKMEEDQMKEEMRKKVKEIRDAQQRRDH